MQLSLIFLAGASLVSGAVIRRGDPTTQEIPTKAKADNTFSNGKPNLGSEVPTVAATPSEIYGVRDFDLPFGRLFHGDMKFFSAGQLNTPGGITDGWMGQPGVVDSANQSACGIPDNAFSISKVAIHPYFLNYVDLDRYCMQDVCISFWNGKQAGRGQSDMILKVTDICSTDPNDPTHCKKPGDIKIDRTKARIMEQVKETGDVKDIAEVNGNQFKDGVSDATSETWWFFTKCWADALVQPAYADNWFAQPPIPNNLDWSQQTEYAQYVQNQISYPKHEPKWEKYANGAYNTTYVDTPVDRWTSTTPDPVWCPIAGGKGWGNPTGNCESSTNQGSSNSASTGTGGTGSSSSTSSSAPATSSTPSTLVIPASKPVNETIGQAALNLNSGNNAHNNAEQVKDGDEDDDTCES